MGEGTVVRLSGLGMFDTGVAEGMRFNYVGCSKRVFIS